jgi:hypothetical protein
MKDSQEVLEVQLSTFFDLHLSRLKCLSSLIISLIQVRTVNLTQLALGLNGSVSSDSNDKRIQRFLRQVAFPYEALCLWIWRLFASEGEVVLAMDRTNWKLGRSNLNILMLSVCHQGIAIPLMWQVLGNKRGNSSEEERIELMKRFLEVIQPDYVIRLVADREFLGHRWLEWLDAHYIHYLIRIRKNQRIAQLNGKEVCAAQLFKATQMSYLRKPRLVSGKRHYLGGKQLPQQKDWLILISNLPLKRGIYYDQQRWQIELLFGAFKSRGFQLEATHLTHPDRVARLLAILSIALAWAVKVGGWKTCQGETINVKAHGRKAHSIFRIGMDLIRERIFHLKSLDAFVQLLSCT